MEKMDYNITNQILSNQDFSTASNFRSENILKNEQNFLPIIKNSYCSILQNGAQFLEEWYAPNFVYHLTFLFQYMVYHGFFSMNMKKFKYQANHDTVFHGMRVMEGHGCCRHITSFYQNLFHVLLSKYSVSGYEIDA